MRRRSDMWRRLSARTLLVLLIAVAGSVRGQEAGPAAGDENRVAVSRDPGVVVASIRRHLGEYRGAGEGPWLEIYGDGTVRVHYPATMKRAGVTA